MAAALDVQFDVKDTVLSNSTFGPQEIEQLRRAIGRDPTQLAHFRDAVKELAMRDGQTPASATRLGVCQYLLGRFEDAVRTFQNSDRGALAYFYAGKALFELGRYNEAIHSYNSAKTAGYGDDFCHMAIAEAHRYAGRTQEAMNLLDQMFGPVEQTAEYLYQRGATVAAMGANPVEVVKLYERAVDVDGRHPGALFGLALENERRGNDDSAMTLYQRAVDVYPAHMGSLMNLGLLYEDRQEFDRAARCYQRVLDSHPGHERARLYCKDAGATGNVFYDEEAQRRQDRLSQVLNIPVTDFELSVRSRNCLQKMGIRTLGDLARTTEAELLASKNFGETSLVEIRDMLNAKGLVLGQFAHERVEAEPVVDYTAMSPDEQALLTRPIADLNLSVRARKCMVRLGISTIAELVRKTGDDLLECKNFGVTSLNEVREKLALFHIKLRGD